MLNKKFSSTLFNNERRSLNNIVAIKELEDWLD